MKTSNPVLSRLGQAAERERTAGYGAYGPTGAPGYGQPYPTAQGYPAAAPAVQPMTIDDVVVKTVTLLGITGASAVVAWNVIPDSLTGAAWIGAAAGPYAPYPAERSRSAAWPRRESTGLLVFTVSSLPLRLWHVTCLSRVSAGITRCGPQRL